MAFPNPAAQKKPKKKSYLLRAFLTSVGLLGLSYGFHRASEEFPATSTIHQFGHKLGVVGFSSLRILRNIFTAVLMTADYQWNLHGLDEENSLERQLKMRELHRRNARRLKFLLFQNGGIYLKFAQHIAQGRHLLPEEYVDICKDSLQNAPVSEDFQEIRQTFKEEFGMFPEEIFIQFDEKPIAAASLAQVHYAKLSNPSYNPDIPADSPDFQLPVLPVAVKVQHRFLQDSVEADLLVIESIVSVVKFFYPHIDYSWLAETVRRNLPLECNFNVEAQNCERTRSLFANNPDVVIPKIFFPLTSSRILTMEFMEGVECTKKEKLLEWGISTTAVSELIANVFCEMIFSSGFLHADPHPGNVFVRPHPQNPSKPQIVLLDHGLYAQLDEEVRYQYSNLWRSLIFSDPVGIEKWAREFCGDFWMIFSGMISRKSWDEIVPESSSKTGKSSAGLDKSHAFLHLTQEYSEEAKAKLIANTVQYSTEIQQCLSKLPIELILILKTNDCLRHIDYELNSPYNGFLIMTRYCIENINQYNLAHSGGRNRYYSVDHPYNRYSPFWLRCQNFYRILSIEWMIFLFDNYLLFQGIFSSLLAPLRWIKQESRKDKKKKRKRKNDPTVLILSVQE